MGRLDLLPDNISEPKDLVDAFRSRRPHGQLNEADRTVLQAPEFARGWNEIARAVRHGLSLEPKLRELVICAVGTLTGAQYEVAKHAPEFLAAGGSREQLDAIDDVDSAADNTAIFDAVERAALQLAIEMTRNIVVRDETFENVRQSLGSQKKVVELIGCISMYNMVARLLMALKIELTGPSPSVEST
jgi:alkylhydroperoxidase family enzyme